MEDPLTNFKLSESRSIWKKKLDNNLIKGVIKENQNKYKYYFKKGEDSISSFVEYNADGYDFGNLRSIKFALGQDSTNKIFYNYNYNETLIVLDSASVYNFKSWLIAYYGSPDDTIKSTINHYLKHDSDYHYFPFSTGALVWEKDKYDVVFNKGEFIKSSNNPEKRIYVDPTLVFKMKYYERRIKQIGDSVRNTLRPNDLIKVNFNFLRVNKKSDYKYELFFEISDFFRFGKEELRKVTNVNMDIVLTDEFDDEILRIENSKFDLKDNPIKLDPGFHQPNSYDFTKNYYINGSLESKQILKAKQLYKDDRLKIRADVKAIIFEDGEIFK
jgi:hypothetical protein